MARPDVRKLAEEVCKACESAPVLLRPPRQGSMKNGAGNGTSKEEKAMCRENLKAAAESLKAGAAKCALMADEICSNYTVAKPLLGGLEKSVTAICAVCYTLQVEAGPTLAAQLSTAVVKVAEASCFFITTLLKQAAPAELNRQAGVVFQRCEDLCKTAIDNRTAIGRKFVQNAVQVKDTIREVKELRDDLIRPSSAAKRPLEATPSDSGLASLREDGQTEPNSQEPHIDTQHALSQISLADGDVPGNSDDRDSSDGDIELLNFCTGEASQEEVAIVDDVLSLMELLSVHLTAILKKLHSCSPDLADELDAWECSAAKTAGLAVAINDLGAALYPPQTRQEVQTCLQAVLDIYDSMNGSLPSSAGPLPEAKDFVSRIDKVQHAIIALGS